MSNKGLFKYQQGGFAQFIPLTDAEKKKQEATDLRAEKQSNKMAVAAAKNKPVMGLDPEIFNKIADNGITSDVYALEGQVNDKMMQYQGMSEIEKSSYRGRKLMSDLTSGMISDYNKLNRSAKMLDEAKKQADENNSYREDAMTDDGRFIVQDKDGNINALSLNQIKNAKEDGTFDEKYRTVSVGTAIQMRESKYPGADILTNAVQSTVGETQVNEWINEQLTNIGSTAVKNSGSTVNEVLANAPSTLKEASVSSNKAQVMDALAKIKKNIPDSYIMKLKKDVLMRGGSVDDLLYSHVKQLFDVDTSKTDYSVDEQAKLGVGSGKDANIGDHQTATRGVGGVDKFSFGQDLILNVTSTSIAASSTITSGDPMQSLSQTKFMKMATSPTGVSITGEKLNANDAVLQQGTQLKLIQNFPLKNGKPDPQAFIAMNKFKQKIKKAENDLGKKFTMAEKRAEYAKNHYDMDDNGNPIPRERGNIMAAQIITNANAVDLNDSQYEELSNTDKNLYNQTFASQSLGWFRDPIKTAIFMNYNPDMARSADGFASKEHEAIADTRARLSEKANIKRSKEEQSQGNKLRGALSSGNEITL